MLRARGVQGVIFIFTEPTGAFVDFPWDNFAALGLDHAQREPLLHTVCLDHYQTLMAALARLAAAGYARIGLFLERYKDDRIAHKWSAAFAAFQRVSGAIGAVPLLIRERIDEAGFRAWHHAHRPDLVVGHLDACVGWLARARPRTDFFNLNWSARTLPCAGLDLRMELQGAVAAETLIAQLQRGERGLPADPRTIMVPGKWVDGPTLRRPAPASAR
jgi:LacI family transcriptional regulator